MAETAPNKTAPGSGILDPVGKVPGSQHHPTSTATHHIKRIIESYSMSATRSMLGPGSGPVDMVAYSSKMYSQPYAQSLASHATPYKLPPDVELCKTNSPDEDTKSSLHGDDEDQSLKRSASLQRRESSERISVKSDSQSSLSGYDELKPQNGQVTLSRVDMRQRHGSSHSNKSGGGNRHLTGEMIRQLQERKLHQPPLTTTTAGATVPTHQQLLQINAVYERALKEKSYLRQETSSRLPGASQPPLSGAFKTPPTSGPVLIPQDRGHSKLEETRLAGKDIACFTIGGEKRLCLPQILNSVLDQISLPGIHAACDELQIFCSTCTPEQLEKFKLAKILPMHAAQCGLITKSDAERLCSTLLDRTPPLASLSGFRAKSSPFSFRVQHFCFGSCRGIVLPEAYTSPGARCIECLDCEGLFCPSKFVSHSHQNRENRTCHWGFDSSNWRAYLMLSDDYTESEREKLSKTFSDFKARYTNKRKQRESSPVSAPANGGNGSNLTKLEESRTSTDLDGPSSTKKPRVSEQVFQGDPSYGLLLYQSWAQAAAKIGPAAWSAHMAQAVKERKSPFPIVGSSARLKPTLVPPQQSPLAGRHPDPRLLPPIKSSPVSESDSPLHVHDSSSSSGEALSPTSTRRTSSKPSLAEDIHAIRISLEGASSLAREKILKILERLTTRLALAESERDGAMSQLRHLQRRFDALEEELHKKRAELREALRQDGGSLFPVKPRTNGGGELPPSHHRSAVTLELLSEASELRRQRHLAEEIEDLDDFTSTSFIDKSAVVSRNFTSLPKVEMKTPAKVIEEKESVRSSSPSSPAATSDVHDHATSPACESHKVSLTSRRRSGTPASIKSRESEDLRERMLTMEAELRSLREELIRRPSARTTTTTTATKLLKDDETVKTTNGSSDEETLKKPKSDESTCKEERVEKVEKES